MDITKDTTDDELLESVRRAKRNLHLATSDDTLDNNASDDLADVVNNIAVAEGQLAVRYDYRNALRMDSPVDEIRKHLIRLVTNSPNDTYSGRRNDTRRAYHDGLRTEVAAILTLLDRNARTTA